MIQITKICNQGKQFMSFFLKNDKVVKKDKMTVKQLLNLLFFAFILFFVACEKNTFCIEGNGEKTFENIDIKDFVKLHINDIEAKIELYIADSTSVSVDAQPNIIENIRTYITGEVLNIEYNRCVKRHDTINIRITTPYIAGIKLSSDSEINFYGKCTAKNMEIKLHSKGTIYFDTLLIEKNLAIDLTGTGIIEFSKKTISETVTIEHSSGGEIVFRNLTASDVFANCTGSGRTVFYNTDTDCETKPAANKVMANLEKSASIYAVSFCTYNFNITNHSTADSYIWVTGLLDATIYSSGNIYYKGNPPILRVKEESTGNLIKTGN